MRIVLAAAAFALSCLALTPAPAAAESFECPLTTARRGITNTLPSGWFATPVQSRLMSTRVGAIGSQPTMMCDYGGAGLVMREVPADQTCVARTGGFECAAAGGPAPTPSSETHAAGTFTVRGTYEFDLDTGAEAPRTTSDFWYEIYRNNETYFTPRNGAQLAVFGASEPSYSDCAAATTASTRTRIETMGAGAAWVCVRTSEGRIARLHIDGVNHLPRPRVMTITFATWR